jgi:1,4-dihydroxy-2-naphthoate polyprenyltransferase
VAVRPPTLLASVAPVLAGTGVAVGDGAYRPDAFVVTLLSAVLLNVAVNLANDASDHARGVDGPDRIGPPRAVASGLLTARQVWTGTAFVLAVAGAGGVYLALISGWLVLVVGAAAVVAALAYTGGPRPYGYFGLGEPAVFLFFGPVAVAGSRYVHDAAVSGEAALLGVPVGLLAAAILVVNNVRDLDSDRAAGKRTLAVILGRRRTRLLFIGLVVGAFALAATLAAARITPMRTLVVLAASPLAIPPIRYVLTQTAGDALIDALKATARLHLSFGILLGIGAAIG